MDKGARDQQMNTHRG